jgi:hypothetical protein
MRRLKLTAGRWLLAVMVVFLLARALCTDDVKRLAEAPRLVKGRILASRIKKGMKVEDACQLLGQPSYTTVGSQGGCYGYTHLGLSFCYRWDDEGTRRIRVVNLEPLFPDDDD